jgi:predicted ATPase
MKVKVRNLGVLKQAEFTLGELTIICGGNNTGKTYATYALFGFLFTWRQIFSLSLRLPLNDACLGQNLEVLGNIGLPPALFPQ